MDAMRYDPPDSIYKALKPNKEPLDNKTDNAEEAGRNQEKAKINYAVNRDLLTHRNKARKYFACYNKSEGQPGSLTKEEFWFMLSSAMSNEKRLSEKMTRILLSLQLQISEQRR